MEGEVPRRAKDLNVQRQGGVRANFQNDYSRVWMWNVKGLKLEE